MYEQILSFIRNNLDLIVQIQLVLASLSGLFQILGQPAISKVLGTISVVDVGRVVRKLPPKPGTGVGAIFVLLTAITSVLSNGCAGTLEETRGQIRIAAPSARASGTCQTLSSKERTWGGIAIGSAALAGTAGLSTIPLDSHAGDVGLAAGTAVLAATAATALSVQQSYGREWTREGCGQ